MSGLRRSLFLLKIITTAIIIKIFRIKTPTIAIAKGITNELLSLLLPLVLLIPSAPKGEEEGVVAVEVRTTVVVAGVEVKGIDVEEVRVVVTIKSELESEADAEEKATVELEVKNETEDKAVDKADADAEEESNDKVEDRVEDKVEDKAVVEGDGRTEAGVDVDVKNGVGVLLSGIQPNVVLSLTRPFGQVQGVPTGSVDVKLEQLIVELMRSQYSFPLSGKTSPHVEQKLFSPEVAFAPAKYIYAVPEFTE